MVLIIIIIVIRQSR